MLKKTQERIIVEFKEEKTRIQVKNLVEESDQVLKIIHENVKPLIEKRNIEMEKCIHLSEGLEESANEFEATAKKVKRKHKYPWLWRLGKMCSQGISKQDQDEENIDQLGKRKC